MPKSKLKSWVKLLGTPSFNPEKFARALEFRKGFVDGTHATTQTFGSTYRKLAWLTNLGVTS